MWSLWNTRNDIHHGKKSIEHTLAIDWALDACFHLLTSQQGSCSDTGEPGGEVVTAARGCGENKL
jgi:hypothetical protein